MQSVTVAERRVKPSAVAQTRSGAEENQEMVPALSFVRPIPGFTDLRQFVLVRLEPEAAAEPAPGSASGSASGSGSGSASGSGSVAESASGLAGDEAAPAGGGESPLYELRSLERPEVRFMMAVPGAYFSDYEIELDDQECGDLGLTASVDALVLVMLTVGPDAASTTANLLAPVVINARTRAAAQVILTGSDWPVRAPIG
jgi:flagellar assembly factor FliW